jgi:hypothetical protein
MEQFLILLKSHLRIFFCQDDSFGLYLKSHLQNKGHIDFLLKVLFFFCFTFRSMIHFELFFGVV